MVKDSLSCGDASWNLTTDDARVTILGSDGQRRARDTFRVLRPPTRAYHFLGCLRIMRAVISAGGPYETPHLILNAVCASRSVSAGRIQDTGTTAAYDGTPDESLAHLGHSAAVAASHALY